MRLAQAGRVKGVDEFDRGLASSLGDSKKIERSLTHLLRR